MVYETKKHCLIKDNGEKVELTELEHKFLIAISDEEITPANVIAKYVFGHYVNGYINKLKELQRRLNKFIRIKRIERIAGVGYKLETEIYFK